MDRTSKVQLVVPRPDTVGDPQNGRTGTDDLPKISRTVDCQVTPRYTRGSRGVSELNVVQDTYFLSFTQSTGVGHVQRVITWSPFSSGSQTGKSIDPLSVRGPPLILTQTTPLSTCLPLLICRRTYSTEKGVVGGRGPPVRPQVGSFDPTGEAFLGPDGPVSLLGRQTTRLRGQY